MIWRNERHATPKLTIALAGLECGIIAGLVALAWLAMVSAWYTRSVWTIANLLASTFYGPAALRRGFRAATLSGLALHLVVSGILGALFAMAVRQYANRLRVTLFGVLLGISWHYLSFRLFWRKVNPLIPLYGPEGAMLFGYLLFGMFLGLFPRYLNALKAEEGATRA